MIIPGRLKIFGSPFTSISGPHLTAAQDECCRLTRCDFNFTEFNRSGSYFEGTLPLSKLGILQTSMLAPQDGYQTVRQCIQLESYNSVRDEKDYIARMNSLFDGSGEINTAVLRTIRGPAFLLDGQHRVAHLHEAWLQGAVTEDLLLPFYLLLYHGDPSSLLKNWSGGEQLMQRV